LTLVSAAPRHPRTLVRQIRRSRSPSGDSSLPPAGFRSDLNQASDNNAPPRPRRTGRQTHQVAVLLSAGPRRARMGEAIHPAPRGMADRRMAQGQGSADRLLALEPAGRHQARTARPARSPALEDRVGLQAAQGRARPGPLRRPLLAGLVSPHRAGHRRPRVPDPGAAEPKSPAAGLTLPQAVRLLQPLFKCWTGRCQTCQQPIDLLTLILRRSRHNERQNLTKHY